MTEASSYPVPFVTRVRIKGFRSIAECDVRLGPLTVLVGFNAAGKSNFLDALKFVQDAVETSLTRAVSSRGGLETLLHRSPAGTAASLTIQLDLSLHLPDGDGPFAMRYGFEVGADPAGDQPLVLAESAQIDRPDGTFDLGLGPTKRFTRLALPVSAEDPQFEIETGLLAMRFYELSSAALREVDEPLKDTPRLGPKGEHLGRVLGELSGDSLGKERFDAYMAALVPGVLGVDERREGRYSTVQVRFDADDGTEEAVFLRESLSEGTLRAAGTLAALLPKAGRSLLAIEAPETALHPARVGALYEALDDAAAHTQVIVTSQSSDLLDNEYASIEHIRVVERVDLATRIGPVDAGSRAVVEERLMTLAELHRSGQLRAEDGAAAQDVERSIAGLA